jgi:two-component system sensor histidine kinase RpfC
MQTASTLQVVLAKQARLRAFIGIPMTWVLVWLHYAASKTFLWAEWAIASYFIYIAVTWAASRWLPERLWTPAIYCTAVLDAVFLIFWLPLIEDAAGLILGFALFTGLGYGLRTGNKYVMMVNQAVTLAGYAVILAIYPVWLQQPIRALAFAVPLIIIPVYVGALLDQLHAARQRAEEESRAKSDMLAKVSHELRTPLGGIVSAADLIHMAAPAAPQGRLASTIIALAKHLQEDIADLLDQAKYTAKALILNPGGCDIRELIGTVEAAVRPKATEKHLDLQVLIDPRLDSASIADAHYLGRALLNLAGNAVKFTERGQVVIRVLVLDMTPSKYYLRFSVEDSGVGIAMADQEKIFTPFVQLDAGPARRVDGTGLGLSICKDVVELMGARLRLSSEPGRGSRFWFDVYFPRAEPLPVLPAAPMQRAVAPRRILVVDDNVTNLHLLREILEQEGHVVSVAESGQAALDLLGGAGPVPEIIFLDYNLGDMDGIQVLQIYHFGVRQPAPVFFLTADMSPNTLVRLRASAARGVIGKPVRLAEIRETLAKVFADGNADASAQTGSKSQSGLCSVPVVYVDIEVLAEVAAVSKRPEFLAEMLDRAILDIERTSATLLTALDEGRWDEAKKLAHALKGVTQQMGAFKLKNLAISIMQMDIAGLKGSRRKLAAELADLGANSVAALREVRTAPRPNAAGEWVA